MVGARIFGNSIIQHRHFVGRIRNDNRRALDATGSTMKPSAMAAANIDQSLISTREIHEWRSIVTLILFVITNIIVLRPFHIPIFVPRKVVDIFLDTLSAVRIIAPRQKLSSQQSESCTNDDTVIDQDDDHNGKIKAFVRINFPLNFITAPLIADLFLLAISAIGREEVRGGTIGANNINPLDIMIFFITLAYIAISIDASGLVRYLAFKVLQWGGKVGHRLFFFLYAFFFALGSFVGNDPIILSGTAFLAYMTRVSSNIVHPRAWIHTQFAVANIASAILVSSNPTNLVLAGAFDIKFIVYTANMIVPVLVTAIVLFPFLLYIVFANRDLIPYSINMHELPEEVRGRKPVNPNIPHARGQLDEDEAELAGDERGNLLSLEEIMNPFLDKGGAAFGAVIMAVTLITVLALNAASEKIGPHPVFYVTLPAAFVMFCWDLSFGWCHRKETRQIARKGKQDVELAKAERAARKEENSPSSLKGNVTETPGLFALSSLPPPGVELPEDKRDASAGHTARDSTISSSRSESETPASRSPPNPVILISESSLANEAFATEAKIDTQSQGEETTIWPCHSNSDLHQSTDAKDNKISPHFPIQEKTNDAHEMSDIEAPFSPGPTTLVSLARSAFVWCQETFPTATAVVAHLPFALVPFAFTMFVLVQALVTKGWVPVFAHGWDHWVKKTGTIGAIGGMGFLSVVLCNFAGTNIGTTILLSRVIQSWREIHLASGVPITDRTFWATVYSMALGVNYGAFSTAFSASLAGLLWRDILMRKHIRVRSLDFARVNLPIIAIAMVVGCLTLLGEVYIVRKNVPYTWKS